MPCHTSTVARERSRDAFLNNPYRLCSILKKKSQHNHPRYIWAVWSWAPQSRVSPRAGTVAEKQYLSIEILASWHLEWKLHLFHSLHQSFRARWPHSHHISLYPWILIFIIYLFIFCKSFAASRSTLMNCSLRRTSRTTVGSERQQSLKCTQKIMDRLVYQWSPFFSTV